VPEGHTVHRLARTFAGLLGGQALRVSSPQGRFADGAALLDGQVLVASEAWGKQLFLGFAPVSGGPRVERWLRVHLGLYGAWTFAGDGSADVVHAIGAPRKRIGERETVPVPAPTPELSGAEDPLGSPAPDSSQVAEHEDAWVPPGPRGAVRVRLLGAHAVADLTGPAACEVVTPEEKASVEARLGPDPIRPDGGHASLDTARDAFVARVRRSRVAVGQQLMDQGVVAGVGNIYRAESLFRAGVDPLRPGRDVPATTLAELWDDLVALMRDGTATGGIVTTRPEHRGLPDGGTLAGAPGRRRTRQNTDDTPGAVPAEEAFYVYHRDGLPCRVCGTPVLTEELAGRALYWCAACQA
jgi:endonuclease-8